MRQMTANAPGNALHAISFFAVAGDLHLFFLHTDADPGLSLSLPQAALPSLPLPAFAHFTPQKPSPWGEGVSLNGLTDVG